MGGKLGAEQWRLGSQPAPGEGVVVVVVVVDDVVVVVGGRGGEALVALVPDVGRGQLFLK